MTPERWQRIKDVFARTLVIREDERAPFLNQICLEDELLRAQVESLLMHHQEAEEVDFLQLNAPARVESISFISREESVEKPIKADFGSHELLGELGRGGMGVVYKARDKRLNRIVALKLVKTGQLGAGEEVSRFQAEAEAAAALEHPSIVPIYEIGEHEGCHFFSMAYVEGQSLAEKLSEGPLPDHEAARIVKAIAQAVQYAHEQGIIHRDLKPGNILLTPSGEAKVTDFGLAKRLDKESVQTKTGVILGTPSYMSPEQAEGRVKEIRSPTDVHALGAILYEAVTGRAPFRGATVMETIDQVRHDEPAPPRALRPKLARDLETICLKCLRKSPADRYESAKALVDDLGHYLGGAPIKARPISATERAWKWARRNRSVATAASITFAALLVLVIGLSVAFVRVSEARQEERTQLTISQQEKARGDRNLTWARKAAFETAFRLFKNRHFRETPELKELREDLLASNVAFYDDVVQQVSDNPILEAERGRAYLLLVNARSDMGNKERALADARKMEEIFARLAANAPSDVDAQYMWGWSFGWQSNLQRDLGENDKAERVLTKAIDILEKSAKEHPLHVGSAVKLGACFMHRGSLADDRGEEESALKWYLKAIEKLDVTYAPREAELEDQTYYLRMAYEKAAAKTTGLKRWTDAVHVLERRVQLEPKNAVHWYDLALAQLAIGDKRAYRKTCAEMLKRFEARDARVADRIVYTCVPAADAVENMDRLITLAQEATKLWPGNTRLLAAVFYRKGDYASAVRFFEQTPMDAIRAWDWLFAAMAHHGLGNAEKARECLKKAIAWIEKNTKNGRLDVGWTEELELQFLRDEAESLVFGN
jgi:tetratricopeptide (TPR) repeat protein/tRNA A-37 threonylcarbamoyl transferase component Bud32